MSSAETVTAAELQSRYPARFQKEYSSWCEYACDYDWWEFSEEHFKSRMQAKGYDVTRIFFSISYSQGDYASFEGSINVAEWMLTKGYDETYPALFLAVKDYGEYASVNNRHRGSWPSVSFDGNCVGNTYAAGVFKHLDDEAWDELVDEQFNAAGIEDEMQSEVAAECRQLYSDLRDEYEHLTSEESFIESCEANGITFEMEKEHEVHLED